MELEIMLWSMLLASDQYLYCLNYLFKLPQMENKYGFRAIHRAGGKLDYSLRPS